MKTKANVKKMFRFPSAMLQGVPQNSRGERVLSVLDRAKTAGRTGILPVLDRTDTVSGR